MKRIKFLSPTTAACAGLLSVMVLAGCGNSENAETQAPVPAPSPAPMEAPAPEAPVEETTVDETATNSTTDQPIDADRAQQETATNSTTSQPLDADQAEDIVEDSLKKDADLKFFDLDADDEGNTIVLKGKVQTEAQKKSAEQIAKRMAPGISIINRLTVG